MASRDEIITFADELLSIGEFGDYGPNGLQVPGAAEVRTIVSGVSANLALIEAALERNADLLIAHHGLFWDFHPRSLNEAMAARLRLALGAGLSIAGYHLPLDAHPEIGNNALLCERLGFESEDRFAEARGSRIGVIGRYPGGIGSEELVGRVTTLLDREPLLLGDGPGRVELAGFVTGAGASFVHEAVELGLDALLTGEPAEHVSADAREGCIHFLAAGHHATERLGIARLGEIIAERFGLEHSFAEVQNPV